MTANKKFKTDVDRIVRQYRDYLEFADSVEIVAEWPKGTILLFKKVAGTIRKFNLAWRALPEHLRKRLAAEAQYESLKFRNTPVSQSVYTDDLLPIGQSLERAAQIVLCEAPTKRAVNERRQRFLDEISKVFKAHKKPFTSTIDPINDSPSIAVKIVSNAFGISFAAASKEIQRFKTRGSKKKTKR
jgi:hypothetical protein